ncbi:MAG: hypothetical protein NTY07_10485 [Bacteroidia bacterium]|nr:hypothetical protein [Bacteroidia bacterium]
MLEVGNIYELKLSHKIEEHGLLIFDINSNISARLHIRNLSNNPALSKKMFELFDVGHEVTVFVTDFNEEKNYYELSTKAFRNSLDDVLSFNKCREIINREFQEYSQLSERHLTQYRNILNRLRGDLASTGLSFLYELLQNAIDHPNNNFNKELSIHFEVFDNYLLLKHNGALFTENNFKSICGILYGEQLNETGSNRIGYKGIGFKSVFRHTNNVYIRSGNFSFCFKKGIDGENMPWEVMPIFQNEIDKIDKISQFDFFNSPVAFAFEFPSEEYKSNVIQYLTELAQNPYLVIFLDKLKKLKITTPSNEHVFEKEIINDEVGRNTIRLIIDGSVCSDWVSFSDTFLIEDQKIINELTDENNKSIPEHFRQFRNPQIDLIVPLNKIENPINLFAYLPLSATRYQLDYIVNGDFIPNLDRSNIIENLSYNLKLADFAGFQVLRACESFAIKSEFKKLKQIFPSFEAGVNRFKDNVQMSFIERVNDSQIFPSYYDGKLNSFANTLVDNTELYLILPQNQYNDLTYTTGNPLNPASDLQSEYFFLYDKFENGKIFKKEDLLSCLKAESFQNWLKKPENCFSIITHFDSRSELQALLKTENVFLNSNNELVSSNSLYNAVPDEISFIGINVLNSELLELVKRKELSFKLLDFEPVDFFKKHILGKEQATNSLLLNEDNLIAFWKFIYMYWESLEKEAAVINSLKNIHILCKSRNNNTIIYKPISSTYMSLEFNTASDIESVINIIGITDVEFISEKYIVDNYKVENWRRIFKKSDAITDLQAVIGVLIPQLSSIDEQKHYDIGKQIFKYWKDNKDKETQLSTNQITAVSNNIKIKCNDGSFLKASDCIIADHYTTNPIIDTFLPEIKLNNQISDDYDKRTSNILEWYNFFKLIGCQTLSERQNVFDAKIKHLIKNQELFREKHFEILQTISQLHKEKKDNNFSFDKLSELYLKTTTDEWLLPSQIHFSSVYNPKLDLQKNEAICNNFVFLNSEYVPEKISSNLLKNLGVQNNFRFEVIDSLRFDELNNNVIKNRLFNGHKFKNKKEYLLSRYNLNQIQNYTKFKNHIDCYPQLSTIILHHYNKLFFDEILDLKDDYFSPTKIINNGTIYDYCDNGLIFFIKENDTVENCDGDFVKPTTLYSVKLSKYINETSLLPKSDIFCKHFKSEESVEKIIGIQQEINPNICIQLLCRDEENRISFKELKELNIVAILKDYIPTVEEKSKLFLLNKNLEWKSLNELFISSDEKFQIEPSQELHEDFRTIAKNFGVQELSNDSCVLKTKPETPSTTEEIKTIFISKAKFIAFKIAHTNYQEIESELIENIKQIDFYEVESMAKVFPKDNPIYREEIESFIKTDENKIFYKGYWKTNSDVIAYLFGLIKQGNIERVWFDNVINRWENNKIIELLEGEFGVTPFEKDESSQNTREAELAEKEAEIEKLKSQIQHKEEERNTTFLDEINDFIAELEDTEEWREYTPELKNILSNYTTHPKEKQKLFNLIAKLKLAKERNIHFEIADKDYNHLENGTEKYFVHSARGAFAYIHPNEILKMKSEGYKMALDFNTMARIKIYKTAEEILQLNTNHILAYQNEKTMEDLFSFCEANRDANKHLLIIDRNHSGEKSKALLKLLDIEDDYQ